MGTPMIVVNRARRWLWGPVLVGALLAAGCGGTETVYFRPAQSPQMAGSGWVAKTTYRLPEAVGPVTVQLAARGEIKREKGGAESQGLAVRFSVDNRGPAAFTLDPKKVTFVDDEGRSVTGVWAYQGSQATGTITVAGGAKTVVDLAVSLPPEVRFESLGSFRLTWPYVYGDKSSQVQSKFIKVEEVTYESPDYYGPLYYGPPYYGPWHYDPWYGPYGYRRFDDVRHHRSRH